MKKQNKKRCEVNVGETDKLIRIILGLSFLGVGYFYRVSIGNWQYLLYFLALMLIITGLKRKCLAYCPFNINTNKK